MKLKNKTIVVTRQPEQAQNFLNLIRQSGAQALLFPTIATVASMDNRAEQDRVLEQLERFDWLIFSSQNAVRYFFDRLNEQNRSLPELKIAAVGSKTAQALTTLGVKVDLVPDDFSAKGLLNALATTELRGKTFLIPTSDRAREELQTGLKLNGAKVESIAFYQTVPNPHFDQKRFRQLLSAKKVDVLTFFSPSAFHFLVEILCDDGLNLLQLSGVHLAAIGPTTARAINNQGLQVHIVPKVSTSKGMLDAIIQFYKGKNDV